MNDRVCAKCGRAGKERSFRYTIRGVYVCTAITACGKRQRDRAKAAALDGCPNALHDHPLPRGYVAASDEADERLTAGWENRKCPDCNLYGWEPPHA